MRHLGRRAESRTRQLKVSLREKQRLGLLLEREKRARRAAQRELQLERRRAAGKEISLSREIGELKRKLDTVCNDSNTGVVEQLLVALKSASANEKALPAERHHKQLYPGARHSIAPARGPESNSSSLKTSGMWSSSSINSKGGRNYLGDSPRSNQELESEEKEREWSTSSTRDGFNKGKLGNNISAPINLSARRRPAPDQRSTISTISESQSSISSADYFDAMARQSDFYKLGAAQAR